MSLNRPYDPYGNSSEIIEHPFPGPIEEYGGKVAEQIEMSRRALQYKSRFETTLPTDAGADGGRGSGGR